MRQLSNNGFDFFFQGYENLYVCFSGFFPDEKGIPVFEFKNMMSKSGSSCLFIKDVFKCWYQLGIDGLGTSLQDTIDFLEGFIKPYKNTVFVGNSMGGYAAILFGLLIEPTNVVAISPQSYLKNDDVLNDHRWETYFERARKNNKNISFLDLREVEKKSDCKIAIYYSFNDFLDKSHIDLLESVHNVQKIPCYGTTHASLVSKLNSSNLLSKIIFHSSKDVNCHTSLFPKGRIVF